MTVRAIEETTRSYKLNQSQPSKLKWWSLTESARKIAGRQSANQPSLTSWDDNDLYLKTIVLGSTEVPLNSTGIGM
jgi:hypothetical protein